MRVNVYAEEMTDRIEIVSKTIDGGTYTGVRFYLYLPVTVGGPGGAEPGAQGVFPPINGKAAQIRGPFLHRDGDDDSSAVTFWGKAQLKSALRKALELLEAHGESGEGKA